MQSRFGVILAFAAIVLAVGPLHAVDEAGYTIQAGSCEVQLTFIASDLQGRILTDLRSSDVAVVDNGRIIRQFRSFRRASENPVNLVILIDVSDSMASQIPDVAAKVKKIVQDTAWAARDRVSIVSFGGMEPRLICAFNCDGGAAAAQLDALRAAGLTPLYDAIVQAADLLKDDSDPESRGAMIVFSDGVDSISMHSLADALGAAQNLQAAIYSINAGSRNHVSSVGSSVLDTLAANTGGLSFGPGKDAGAVVPAILDDLRSGYVLTYELPERSLGQHSVRILPTSDPKVRFRSRQSYSELGEH